METVNQVNATPEAPETTERTFTQAELDSIINERLQRERSKYADYSSLKEKADSYDQYVEANKSELQKAQEKAATLQKELDGLKQEAAVKAVREKVSKDTGVPADLLTATTEEECKAQADAIKAFAKPSYPQVRDSGELSGNQKSSTAQQFADWFNQSF